MLVQISNNTCKLVNPSDEDVQWMYGFLSFRDAKNEIRERLGHKIWGDGRVHLFSDRTHQYPTGLQYLVRQQAEKLGKPLEEVDVREPMPELSPEMLEELQQEPWTLRDYQLEAIKMVADPVRPHAMPGRGILHHVTGAGKSRVAPALAHAFGGRWAFLVHRSHLGRDVAGRWEELTGTKAGMVMDGEVSPRECFTCCTFQTLKSRFKSDKSLKAWAQQVTGVVVDECHITAARDIVKVLQQFKDARIRVGLSATPLDRTDKRSLVSVAMLGPVIHRIKAPELVDRGVLARPTVKLVRCDQSSAAGTWQQAYLELVVDSAKRNGMILDAMRAEERPGMVFVKQVKHGLNLVRLAERAGLTVRFIDGDKNPAQRDRAIRDLRDARLDWVVCTNVFNEGVDIPGLRTVILGGGGQSVISVLQQIGRCLRSEEGKTEATVIDIDDWGNKWLRKHSRARVKACCREGYEVVET